MKSDVISDLLDFLEQEKLKIILKKKSDSEFWLESYDNSISSRFIIDNDEIFYDIFSPINEKHLRIETVKDIEKIEFISEERENWEFGKFLEDLWLVIDKIKIWTRTNNFNLKQKKLI